MHIKLLLPIEGKQWQFYYHPILADNFSRRPQSNLSLGMPQQAICTAVLNSNMKSFHFYLIPLQTRMDTLHTWGFNFRTMIIFIWGHTVPNCWYLFNQYKSCTSQDHSSDALPILTSKWVWDDSPLCYKSNSFPRSMT